MSVSVGDIDRGPVHRVGGLPVGFWRLLGMGGFAFLFLHLAFGLGGHGLDDAVNRWLYDALELFAAAACLVRAIRIPAERLTWTLLALGVTSFALGDVCYDFVYGGAAPTPSVADPFYLAFYPLSYVAILMLLRARASSFTVSLWLDGMTAAVASAAVAAAIVLGAELHAAGGSRTAVLLNLAYPTGDILLLALVVFVFSVTGWRPGRAWASVGLAYALAAVADSIYLYENATDSYTEGTLLDAIWPAALLLLALAAWQASTRRFRIDLAGRPLLATPIVCGLAGVGVLIAGRYLDLNVPALALAAGAIVLVLLRTALAFRENASLLERARSQSLTDALTGLGNRRKLLVDLDSALADGPEGDPHLLIIFDLNGFKRYNDTYGHPAGDALLTRLAQALDHVASPFGTAYRLGGDEFCVLATVTADGAEALLDATSKALSEQSEGFTVSASFGAVFVPDEAADPSSALRAADERLYAEKSRLHGRRGEPHEVLLCALSEREPGLRRHGDDVADLSVAVGRRLGLEADALEDLRLGAELHDVGKLAIPDSVLRKPDSLSPGELTFMRRHTVIGQRIMAGSPSLRTVGVIVRATHECWNGDGYPDGLVQDAIPLEARIIAVCDAFAAMTTDRPYRRARTPAGAVEELRRCAGTQFDPAVVAAFCAELEARPRPEDVAARLRI
jgi:two-component system cell cycle response regulator